jgi:type IV pilus assembly protein PilW
MKRMHAQKGFTLVELMVSMLLGLVLVGGVISVLIANRNNYKTNEGLSQVQETARTAFELLARDVRQAGGTGCDNARRMANVLTASTTWWQNWASVQGFDNTLTDSAVAVGTTAGTRVATTDTLHMHSIEGGGFPILTHNAGAGTIQLNTTGATLTAADILVACDFDHSTIFQAQSFTPATQTIAYSTGGTPGNCSTGLGFPTSCAGAGNVYTFPRNSWVGRLEAVTWYVGNNMRPEDGGRSLYRIRLGPGGAPVTEEVIAGVTDMQITYGRNGVNTVNDTGAAFTAADWAQVNSVFISLTVTSMTQRVSSNQALNSGRLTRTFKWIVTLRNRVA